MEILKAFVTDGVQFVIMGAVAVLAVIAGSKVRKLKDAKKDGNE